MTVPDGSEDDKNASRIASTTSANGYTVWLKKSLKVKLGDGQSAVVTIRDGRVSAKKLSSPKLSSKALPGESLSDFAARHGVDNIGGKWFVLDEHRQKVSTPCDTLDQATQLIKSAKVRANNTPAEDSVERSLFADLKKELGLLSRAKTRCGINDE